MSGEELPEGWAEATLTEVADLVRSTIDPQTQPDTSFNYVSLEWVGSGTGAEPPLHPTLGRDIGSSKLPFRAGDVLYGKLRPYLRKVFLATRDGVAVTDLVPLRAKPGVDPSYIKHFLLGPAHDDYVAPLMKGIGMPRLGVGDLEAMPFPVAPSQEQKRIVARLDALQARSRAAREALAEVPALLDTFRQSVLAAAFRGDLTAEWRAKNPDVEPASKLLERIRAERKRRWEKANPKKKYVEPEPMDDSELPELPAGWVWARWAEVGFSQNGRAFPSSEYGPQGMKLLRPGNLHVSGEVRWTPENTRCMPDSWAEEYPDFIVGPGDLVMNLTAQSLKDEFLGRVCLAGPGERCLLNQRIARLTPVFLVPEFCLWMLKAPMFRRFVDGLNTGSLIQHMFTSQLDSFALPVPPLAEQEALCGRVRRWQEAVTAAMSALGSAESDLDTLDQSILARAFRGDLVEQDPNDEPAQALLARLRGQPGEAGGRRRGRPPGSEDPLR